MTVVTCLLTHFNENPKVEALVCDLNKAFIEKKSLSRESNNFKIVKSRINKKLVMYVHYTVELMEILDPY